MPDAAGNRANLFSLFKETVALYHRLTAEASAIHRRGSLSGPRRTVLVALSQSGPQTVARLARTRAQARQRLQPLVHGLIQEGLAKAVENPMHVQSPLIVLTAKGEKEVRRNPHARSRPPVSPASAQLGPVGRRRRSRAARCSRRTRAAVACHACSTAPLARENAIIAPREAAASSVD